MTGTVTLATVQIYDEKGQRSRKNKSMQDVFNTVFTHSTKLVTVYTCERLFIIQIIRQKSERRRTKAYKPMVFT